MKKRHYIIVVSACLVWLTQCSGFALSEPIAFRSRIQLTPMVEEDDDSSTWDIRQMEEMKLAEIEDESLKKVAQGESFSEWKEFDDEYLSFRYPDHPDIKLEVKRPEDEINIMGGPLKSSRETFLKSYRLALGEHTYALLMFDKTDRFDDTICFCGAVVYTKYLFHNGALFRFDFLKNGAIKKVQMVSNGFRVVFFEWTHLPITQEVYLKLAMGIRLKSGPCDEAKMRKAVFDQYGLIGRLGFLEKGMTREQIQSLLGKPDESSETSIKYIQTIDRRQTTIAIPLEDDTFTGFRGQFRNNITLPAKRGSADWIVETVRPDLFQVNATRPSLSQQEIDYIFKRFLEIGPTVEGWKWNRLCMAMHELGKEGHKNDSILPLVRRRFLEADVSQDFATWLLHEYDPEGSRELFAKRIRLILDETKPVPETVKEEDWLFGIWNDLHNLLCFLGKSHPKREALILEALDHPHPEVRHAASFFWNCVPEEEAQSRFLRWLEDKDPNTRRLASEAFAEGLGSPKVIPVLKKRLSLETDEEVRGNLRSALDRIEQGEE